MTAPFAKLSPRKTHPAPAPSQDNQPPVSTGDRVAFITLGRHPRTLCGIVVEASYTDQAGHARHLVLTQGRHYLAHPQATRKLSRTRPQA